MEISPIRFRNHPPLRRVWRFVRRGTAGLGLLLILFMFLLVLMPLPVHASTSIVFDSSGTNNCSACVSLMWSHTVGSGSNGILIVGISAVPDAAPATSVKFGATSLTFVGDHTSATHNVHVELWSLLDPPSGTATMITVTYSSITPLTIIGGSVSYFNVAGTGTVASADQPSGTVDTGSVLVSGSSSGDLVVDTLAVLDVAEGIAASPTGPGQTAHWISALSSPFFVGAGSDQPASSPVTMSWSFSSHHGGDIYWSLIAVPLTPFTAPPIPEYPLGLPILAILTIIGYGLVRRRSRNNFR